MFMNKTKSSEKIDLVYVDFLIKQIIILRKTEQLIIS